MAITNDTVLLDILKTVTRVEAMLKEDKQEEQKEDSQESDVPQDPELFSIVLEYMGETNMDLFTVPDGS